MPQTRKPAPERQAEIVEAMLRLLSGLPVEKLSTSRVAQEVGITQAAIFRHYPTKDALWVAALEEVERRAADAWAEAAARGRTPLDRLRRVMAAQLRLIARYPAIPALIFNAGRLAAEDAIRPVHLRVMAGLRDRLATEARAAAEAGQIVAAVPPGDCADLFLGLLQGAVLRWQLTDDGFDLVAEGARLTELQLRLLSRNQTGALP